jgi:hypothetical protein
MLPIHRRNWVFADPAMDQSMREVGVSFHAHDLVARPAARAHNVAPAMVISLISLAYVEEDGLLLSVALLAAIILIGIASAAVWGTMNNCRRGPYQRLVIGQTGLGSSAATYAPAPAIPPRLALAYCRRLLRGPPCPVSAESPEIRATFQSDILGRHFSVRVLSAQPASTVSTRQKVKSARNRADPYIRLLLGTQPKKYDTLAG